MARTLMMPEHIRFPRSVTRFLRANPGYTSKFAHLGLPPEQAYFRCRVLADWAIIRPHLPAAASRVLDIGCGIAGIDLLLYRNLAAPRLFLVDKRRRDQGGRSFDVVALAREFLAANGVPSERIAAFGSGAGGLHEALKKERYDLILSLRGLGYMFPYESYRDTLRQVLGRPGLLILDIRLMDAEALKTDPVAYERFRAVGFPCASRVIRRLGSDFGDAAEIGRSKDYVRVLVKSPAQRHSSMPVIFARLGANMKIEKYVGTIREAVQHIKGRVPGAGCKVGVILGSGLSEAVPHLEGMKVVPYTQIPHFPRTTVAGHEGKLLFGRLHGVPMVVMQGRFHYYEGHSMETIALPIRVMEYLGLKCLIITSAVGSVRRSIKPGHFVVLKDHINLMGRNPLRAFHEEEFGEMFPDLTDAYDPKMRRVILSLCRKRRIPIHEGVYVAVGGPSYETPAEIRAFAMLGADVVGMSVVPEVIVARQMGVRTSVLTWVANMASGLPGASLNHTEVLALGKQVSGRLKGVLHDLLRTASTSPCAS